MHRYIYRYGYMLLMLLMPHDRTRGTIGQETGEEKGGRTGWETRQDRRQDGTRDRTGDRRQHDN